MNWQLSLILLVIVNTAAVVLIKIAADKFPKISVGIFYQFFLCAVIAIIYAIFSGKTHVGSQMILVGVAGFINAFGAYFLWQASRMSLSKTGLFYPLMDVLTIVLAIIFLREATLWNFQLIFGVLLCFLAMWLFGSSDDDEAKKIMNRKWLFYIIAMIIIFGIAGFLIKIFSYQISRQTFLISWYIGALLGAVPILGLEKQNPFRIARKTIWIVLPLSAAILGALLALYWTYQLGGPVSLVLPIRGLAISVIPIIVGWTFFKERKGLGKKDLFVFAIGVAGAVLVLLK